MKTRISQYEHHRRLLKIMRRREKRRHRAQRRAAVDIGVVPISRDGESIFTVRPLQPVEDAQRTKARALHLVTTFGAKFVPQCSTPFNIRARQLKECIHETWRKLEWKLVDFKYDKVCKFPYIKKGTIANLDGAQLK